MAYVDGSNSAPDSTIVLNQGATTPNPAYEHWCKQDQLILAWLINSLSPPILSQVINCETSSQLWQHLTQLYNSQSFAKILEFKLKLQTIRKGSDTCAQYLQKIQAIADRLRSVGAVVLDQDLILYTLQGLGSEFENFVTAFSLRQGFVSIVELHSMLLAHEARIQANLQLHSAAPTVNLSTQQHNNSTEQPVQALVTHYNNRRGNYRGRGRGCHPSNPREEIQCQICSKWGHSASKCYHRFDITYTGTA